MKKVKNIPTYYTFPGTKIFRDTTALPFADGGPLNDKTNHGELLNSIYASALGDYYRAGGMLKRADGSYSPRGLWDNIRANAGSGKAPTKEMLAQEKKINKQYKKGGPLLTKLTPEEEKQFQKFYQSLPDNLQSDDDTYDIRGYWDSEGRPETFDYSRPKENDGYYHAYSINGNTGEYLKSPAHETFQHAVDIDRTMGYRPITNVQGRNIVVENESIKSPEETHFLNNTIGPVNFRTGGQFPRPYSLPEDSYRQGGRGLHNSVYASSNAQYPAVYNFGGTLNNNLATRQQMYMPLDHITRNGGSILSMSNTPELSGEGKDLTVPENSYYYANGGNMNTPWLHNLYPDGGPLLNNLGVSSAINSQAPPGYVWDSQTGQYIPFQNLAEVTVYGNPKSAAEQKNLMLKLEEAKRAFSTMRKQSGYGAGELDIKQKGSIAGLKHNIQIYKKALEEQKAMSAKAQQALNVLQKHDPENWKDKTVRDIIENPQAVNDLRKLYATKKISNMTFNNFYDTFGKWNDQNAAKGTGPNAAYSAKEAREKWGSSEGWKNFTNLVNKVAIGLPLVGAAGAIVNPGSLSLLANGARTFFANPYVGGAMNAYGLYNLPHGISQTYNDFKRGDYGWGTFNGAMTALDATPIGGGIRYARNFVPGIKNVALGNANVSDLFKPVDLLQVRKDYAQGLINKNQYNTATMGRYYGDTNDAQQIFYWPTKEASEVATRKRIQIPEDEAYIRTKLGGTRASVADRRVDNLSPKGLWSAYITNPDGTLKSKEEIQQIIADLHAEDAFLKTEKQNVLNKIAAGHKNKEFIGRLPIIEHRQKSIYNLLDDAAALEAHKESVPRPEEFDAAIKKVISNGVNGKKVNLSDQDVDMLRYISDHHHDYFSNPEIQSTVDKILTYYPHLKEIKESAAFSSPSEYIFPVGKKPAKITYDEFLNSMGTHSDRAFLNNYLRQHPTKKYSPFVLAAEANLTRNKLLKNPFIGASNLAYHALPYTSSETIPYFGGPEEEHKEQIPTNAPLDIIQERDVTNEVLSNPWATPQQNIFGLRTGGLMNLNNNIKKFPTFTNRFIK